LMSVLIIRFLEMVYINQEQRQRRIAASGSGPFRLELFVEVSAIGDSG
jgi:hypothetical protein